MLATSAPQRKPRSRKIVALSAVVPMAFLPLLGAQAAHAADGETYIYSDFSTFTAEGDAPKGQQGWSGDGNTDTYDWGISGSSLRYSNSLDNYDNYGGIRQLSTPFVDAAGTEDSGATWDTFRSSFSIASSTGGLQPGLNMSVAVDDGAGARSGGFVGFRHIEEGLQVWTTWLPDDATSANGDQWLNDVAVVPADESHQIEIVSHFADLTAPDSLTVYIDGEEALNGHTFAKYHEFQTPDYEPTANSLAFRTGPTAPLPDGEGFEQVRPSAEENTALDGNGFLFSNLSVESYETFPAVPALSDAPEAMPDAPITLPASLKSGDVVDVEIGGFEADEEVYFVWYSEPIFGGWALADDEGVVRAQLTVPADLAAGTHTLQAVGFRSGFVAASEFEVAAAAAGPAGPVTGGLAATGASIEGPGIIGLLALGLGLVAVTTAVVRRRKADAEV
jgi:hypothetical protein